MSSLRRIPGAMTIAEAEAAWDEHILWVMNKLQHHGLEEPTDAAHMRFKHETFVYEQLTGDFVLGSEYGFWRDAKGRLFWWSKKLKEYRICADPELNKYLIQKIQEARNGV